MVWVGDRLNPNWEAAGLPMNRINSITLQKVDNYHILFVPPHPQEPSSRPVILKLDNLNQGTLPTVIQTFNNGYTFYDINPEGNYMLMGNDVGKAIVYKTTDNWTTYSETSKLHIYRSPVDKNEDNEDVYSLNANMWLSHDNVIYSLINYNPYNSISDRIISLIKVPYGNKTTFINGMLDDVEYLE